MKNFALIVFSVFAVQSFASQAFAADEPASMSSSVSAVGAGSMVGYSDYRVRLEESESRFNLGLYVQASQFSLSGRSLLGNAIEVDATYALSSKIAANVSVSQAVTLEGGLGVLYTGIRCAGQYAFWGDFIKRDSTVVINGVRSVQTHSSTASLLAADIGVDQFMFDGSSRVVPATGASFGARYDRSFGSWRASFIGRYGMLLVSSQTSSLMTVGAGLIYSF